VGFLRRLLGGNGPEDGVVADSGSPPDPVELDAMERQRELELLRDEQARLDELQQRQQRYAQYAWQPPAQGGERRAEDGDGASDS
jgi:hypothetical protein